jgi:hypothetical protein
VDDRLQDKKGSRKTTGSDCLTAGKDPDGGYADFSGNAWKKPLMLTRDCVLYSSHWSLWYRAPQPFGTGQRDGGRWSAQAAMDPARGAGGVGCGGFAVSRVRTGFGSQMPGARSDSTVPDIVFSPKSLAYRVFGPVGTAADISYFDVHSDPHRVDGHDYADLSRSRRMFQPSWVTFLLHRATTTALAAGSW